MNFAIHIAAVVQFRNQSEGRVFYDRKIAEGKTHKEAIRALKRRISDRVYNHLVADTQQGHRQLTDKWVREDTQERLCIQRDRLNILNTGSSDKSLPGPNNQT